jgi:Transposase DDE domain
MIDYDARHVVCPTARSAELPARPQPRRPGGHPGHPPAAGLPPLPRPGLLHPLPGQRPARDLPPRQQEAQERIRAEQATDDWRQRYGLRCGVESLFSQTSRLSDLQQTRNGGLATTHLEHVLTALAINLVRVDAWLAGVSTTGSWTSDSSGWAQPLPGT